MATTKKPDKEDKKQKAPPKTLQNRPKTREVLAEKQEPPRVTQMMQVHGKAKLVKELQERRIEQKAEERRSEQAQAVDTLSEEAEITAGAAIEEGIGLLERDLHRLQEWRHTEPPQPPPLAETPPVKEPVYPITPAKADAPRKMPSRQIYRLSAGASSPKTQPVRSNTTGRAVSQADKQVLQKRVSQRMQAHGKLLFRRKRMQAQCVKLQQRHQSVSFLTEPIVTEEIYPIAEKSSTPTAPPSRQVSYQTRNYISGRTDHGTAVPASRRIFSPSAQARQKLLAAKRRDSRRYEALKSPMHTLSSKERRKMVMEKRQRPTRTSTEPDFPLASARPDNVSAAKQSLTRANFPTVPQPAGVTQPLREPGRTVAGNYAMSQVDTPNAAQMLTRSNSGTRGLLPAKRSAPSKTILAREKLAQAKLQVRIPKHKHSAVKTAYQRAWHIRRVCQGKKTVRRGVAALANALQMLVKTGVSFAKNAGVGAFACIILLALVLMVGMAGALAGSPFGVLFSPQETSPEAKSVGAAVAEANNEYFGAVTDIINNTEHDELVIHRVPNDGAADTRLRTWEEILAVFAVKTTTDPTNATDVVMIDDDRTDRLKDVLWDMVSVSKRVETTGSGEDETKTLHLTITVKTPDEVAQDYNFNQVQTGALTEMLLPENKALLTELIGWATGTGDAGSIGGVGNINGYEVPPDALSDERFAAMLNEAKKYLGFPYVWGGSSPSTSFDCSGFVCWVLNKSGAMSIERTTATGIYNCCTVINISEAKPGDLIFFTGTYNSPGPISHIGIYVGDGMMVHCGDPIQFASIESSYWKQHFYAFARIP